MKMDASFIFVIGYNFSSPQVSRSILFAIYVLHKVEIQIA